MIENQRSKFDKWWDDSPVKYTTDRMNFISKQAIAMIACSGFDAGVHACEEESKCGCMMKHEGPCESSKVNPSSAPEWVIEMMKTGKAVRCTIDGKHSREITGYDIRSSHPFKSCMRWYDSVRCQHHEDETYYSKAEPIPAWTPKVGDAVFVRASQDNIAVVSAIMSEKVNVIRQNGDREGWVKRSLKPFDASKIGLPWDEI
jgi:hypothetical protein